MSDIVRITLKNFDKLADRLDPKKFKTRLKKHVKQASKLNGLAAEGEIKRVINAGGTYKANSAITIAIKGSDRPLVDSANLSMSINSRVPRWDVAFVGVLRSRMVQDKQTGRSYDLLNVAFVVHEGAQIKVTPKMRNFFKMMAKQNPGKWFPLRKGTTVITIPPRRFLEAAFDSKPKEIYVKNWIKAIEDALAAR